MKQKKLLMILLLIGTILLSTGCQINGDAIPENNASDRENVSNEASTSQTSTIEHHSLMSECIALASLDILNTTAKENLIIDQSKITEELTLGVALDLFGKPFPDEKSSLYPFVYSWMIEEEKILEIVFEAEDWEEFRQEFDNGGYILPEEEIQYGEGGFRLATKNEIKMLREWILNYKAVSAYIINNGIKTTLFNSK